MRLSISPSCVRIFYMAAKIVFMGSPEFALPALKGLASRYEVVGVVTQPDKPAGRGQVLTPPPVKILAETLHLPVIQPVKLRQPEAMEQLRAWAPEVIVVAAFGQILRQDVLDLPPLGCVNVHGSLLPRWRGASPVQAALLSGDAFTGVTIMRMDAGIDTGPMLAHRALAIQPEDTAGSLTLKLADLGAELLLETLPGYISGAVLPQAQDSALMTKVSMIHKEEGLLDFNQPAAALERRVRAFDPWPGAFITWKGQPMKIRRARVVEQPLAPPGQLAVLGGWPAVACLEGWLVLDEVQPAGKKPMSGVDFLRGARDWAR